jgi:hypothetical protein
VNDRRASLDEDHEIRPAMEKAVREEFERGKSVPVQYFPQDGPAVPDTPRLTVVIIAPNEEWHDASMRERLSESTQLRGTSPRLYPASLVWCVKKQGREMHDAVANWLAWKRVQKETQEGTIGADFEASDLAEVAAKAREAATAIREEIWASYRYVALRDAAEPDGLKVIDLGAGHASAGESLVGRILQALRTNNLLGAGLGAGYLQRNWPTAHAETGAWPLLGLRQSLLNGALIRLVDPEATLLEKVPEFVLRGDFGLATGLHPDGSFDRVWFEELVPTDELSIDAATFLVTRQRAAALRSASASGRERLGGPPEERTTPVVEPQPITSLPPAAQSARLLVRGQIPPELWNRVGTKVLTKLKQLEDLQVAIDLHATVDAARAAHLMRDLQESIADLGLENVIRIEMASINPGAVLETSAPDDNE